MSTTQILDAIAPYTKEELKCARNRGNKARKRADLLLKIDILRAQHFTNEEILNMLNDSFGTTANVA